MTIKFNYPKFTDHALRTIALYDEITEVSHPDRVKVTALGFVTTKWAQINLCGETGAYGVTLCLDKPWDEMTQANAGVNLEIERALTLEGLAAWLQHAKELRKTYRRFQPPWAATADPAGTR